MYQSCVTGTRCVVTWWRQRAFSATQNANVVDDYNGHTYAWLGTLVQDKENETRTVYRRNRYFDPLTGQFTQEDPTGLDGGANQYGFGNGDAVNFSDPFGLRVCFTRATGMSEGDRNSLVRNTQRATQTTFALDANNCATNVQPRGKLTAVSAGFAELANDPDHEYSVFFGSGGSRTKLFKIIIDQGDIGHLYGTTYHGLGQCTASASNARYSLQALIAHEFGEMHGSVVAHDNVLVEGAGLNEAIDWENAVHAREHLPARDQRCHRHE